MTEMKDFDDDVSSMASTFSMVSLNGGEEVDAETAITTAIKDIQDSLNQLEVYMREILMMDFHGESYEIIDGKVKEIETHIKEGKGLWADFLSIARQLRPPKPRATKKKKENATSDLLQTCGGGVG